MSAARIGDHLLAPARPARASRRSDARAARRLPVTDDSAAHATRGVDVRLLGTVDLTAEIEGTEGRQLRMRIVTIEPGGVFGPAHGHAGRPGLVYVLEGTITDHRDGVETDYGPGPGWPRTAPRCTGWRTGAPSLRSRSPSI